MLQEMHKRNLVAAQSDREIFAYHSFPQIDTELLIYISNL